MSFTVSMYRLDRIAENIKYRGSFIANNVPLYVVPSAVDIGNFSNKNIFCDNSIELNLGVLSPVISTYTLASQCTHLVIAAETFLIVGIITQWEYINDGNVHISYRIDPYSSARESGRLDEENALFGVCERANCSVASLFTNLQSEPFAPSDINIADPLLTTSLNNLIWNFERVGPNANGVTGANINFILCVSAAVAEWTGLPAFSVNPTISTPALKSRANLCFYQNEVTFHSGSFYRGIPYRFGTHAALSTFIRQLLSGCGFRTTMPATGWSIQDLTTHRSYLTHENTGGGQNEIGSIVNYGTPIPIEAIRFITAADIYNLYAIPTAFATGQQPYFTSSGFISGFKTVETLHRFGDEDATKSKLLSHPYYYNKVVTCNGDTVNIIPQTHFLDLPGNDHRVWMELRFIGGDTPRLMGRFACRGNEDDTAYTFGSVVEWFTIRSYPAITLSINDSFNPQIQRDVANTRKISSIITNARMSAALDSPIKQGYRDAISGTDSSNVGQSGMDRAYAGIGKVIGKLDMWGASQGFGNPNNGGGAFSNPDLVSALNQQRLTEAGNFITPDITSIMGNDFLSQFGVPACGVYRCGCSDTEFFTFSRYIDRFGQAVNTTLDPLNNQGNLFNGEMVVTPVDDVTYYQFSNIAITAALPMQWKMKIKELFESGVYLIDQ